jgi:hypothetical protein
MNKNYSSLGSNLRVLGGDRKGHYELNGNTRTEAMTLIVDLLINATCRNT